jgi:hypothetical protein
MNENETDSEMNISHENEMLRNDKAQMETLHDNVVGKITNCCTTYL